VVRASAPRGDWEVIVTFTQAVEKQRVKVAREPRIRPPSLWVRVKKAFDPSGRKALGNWLRDERGGKAGKGL
jgi:hypothetical protein